MTSQATEQPTCACGCGTVLRSPGAKWARGHFHRGEGTHTPLPGPGEPVDLDAMMPQYGSDDRRLPDGTPWNPITLDEVGELGGQAAGLDPDPGPAPIRPDSPTRAAGPRVTAALRKDIQAKISLPLEVIGQAWKARDPLCGGRFVEQRPATAAAFTNIVCNSADLIAFFTGPAGGFMLYLDVAAALWPVAEVIFAHHVTHSIGEQDQAAGPGPDLHQYAA